MFRLDHIDKFGIRQGYFENKERNKKTTPCYFITSGFGGGGTSVSRLISYLSLFETGSSQLLLNYYFLNTCFNFEKKSPCFDTAILATLPGAGAIIDFLKQTRIHFIRDKKMAIPDYELKNILWDPYILLDSGSGNIFRDLCCDITDSISFERVYVEQIMDYLNFAFNHDFDSIISMDIAPKNTNKGKEKDNELYLLKIKQFFNETFNIKLLEITLNNLSEQKKTQIYAPLHGTSPLEYSSYLDKVLNLENRYGKKFAGFAIGGLGRINPIDIFQLCKPIRKKLNDTSDQRPIHVLGAGGIKNVIPLCLAGVDTFDCHTPWRRATEGKYSIPLLDSKGNILSKGMNYWRNVKTNLIIGNNFHCDCDVCRQYSIKDIEKMYSSKDTELNSYAQILLFKHNLSQHEFLLNVIKNRDLLELIKKIPASKYKQDLQFMIRT